MEKLGTIPDCNTGCSLLVLQTASHHRVQASESVDNEGTVDGQALEEMLDEERIPVEVIAMLYAYIVTY